MRGLLFVVRERVVNSTSLEQTIQQLKPSTSYEFRVVAWNSDGPSQQAARADLVTRPEGLAIHVQVQVQNWDFWGAVVRNVQAGGGAGRSWPGDPRFRSISLDHIDLLDFHR